VSSLGTQTASVTSSYAGRSSEADILPLAGGRLVTRDFKRKVTVVVETWARRWTRPKQTEEGPTLTRHLGGGALTGSLRGS
jgi:hypothetical protein